MAQVLVIRSVMSLSYLRSRAAFIGIYTQQGKVGMTKDNKEFFKTKTQWSKIKDQLLGCYLIPYFQKVLTTGRPIFYVDCFAGKGKFEDGNPGSPLIALRARDNCLEKTTQRNRRSKIDVCFIELNHAEDLNRNISEFNNTHGCPRVISGRYEDKIEEVLSSRKGENIFLYIDPYGIQALDSGLFDKFETYGFQSLEMLINFNSFGFFRDACRVMGASYIEDEALRDLDDLVEYDPAMVNTSKQSQDLLCRIAGGDYWKDIVLSYRNKEINGYKAEKRLSTEYKERLKQRYNYVLDMPIRLKSGSRPKYRMIHVCNHAEGCFLMAKNMQKRKDELFTNIQQKQQGSLLRLLPSMTSTVENELITINDVKFLVKNLLVELDSDISMTKFLAIFVNKNGLLCEFKMIYTILEELSNSGLISIIRKPSRTETGKASTFWWEERDRQVTIRRLR